MRGNEAFAAWRKRISSHLGEAQHRNAYYLMLNTVLGAAAGVLFWFLLVRIGGLPPADIGLGYTIIALSTIVALVAKGGFDTALLRTIPGASRRAGRRLLRFGILVGAAVALLLMFLVGVTSEATSVLPEIPAEGWAFAAAIAALLVITWIQDSYFLAMGDARFSFQRNVVFSAGRLLLPLPVLWLAAPQPVALSWALALAASAVAALAYARGFAEHEGRWVPRWEFVMTSMRNASGAAAEFLPGLLLVPFVFALEGAEAAAYFGIAWTAASLLFLACAAISRSALAEMVRHGPAGEAAALRRGLLQLGWIVLPAAVAGVLIGPQALAAFGSEYAAKGALVLIVLCASTLVVGPAYLYLAVLRAHERPLPLVVLPLAMIALLAILAPLLEARFGLAGVALAWLAANAPFGGIAAWKLRLKAREVTFGRAPPTLDRAPHVE